MLTGMTSPTREAVSLNEAAAAEVRSLLGRQRLRQSDLARRLGETEVWVSRRLRGIQVLSLSDLERIAQVLDVEPVDLLRSAVRAVTPSTHTKTESPVRPKPGRPKSRGDSRSPMDGSSVRRPRRLIAHEPEAISLSAA